MSIHWGWRIAIGYSSFALGTLTFVLSALTNEVGLVRPDYYEQSLQHDAHAATMTLATALTPALSVDLDDQSRRLRIVLHASMVGVRLSIEVCRP